MNDSKLKTVVALCGAALLTAICAPVAADTLAVTNAAWRVTAAAPTSGWSTSASFDDTAWQSATAVYSVDQYLGPAYVGTKGIWTQAGQFSSTETTIWGRTVLNLASVPQSATLEYGIDDDGDIFVNGTRVVSDQNGIANGGLVDIGAYLVAGANVIAFTATDNFAVYGYNHAAWIQVEGITAAVPEPSTYAMLLLGLGAFGMVRGRSRRER